MPIFCVNILLFCEILQIEQTKNNIAKLLQLYALKEKKKAVGETVQVEQTKNTIASRHLLFLYIDNIIYKKKVGVHDKKKNSSHQIGQMP